MKAAPPSATTRRSTWLRRVLCSLALLLVAGCAGETPTSSSGGAAPAGGQLVTRVIDGDTIVVEGTGTVRLIGVDTPETVDPRRPVQYFGKEASQYTTRVAAERRVRLEFDRERTDRYGRTLAYVYVLPGELFLNAEIIRQGYGFAYTRFPFRYLEQFRGFEREAREARRGMWAPSGEAHSGSPRAGLGTR